MPELLVRAPASDDLDELMPLVRDFYAFEKLELDEARYRKLVISAIENPSLARILVGVLDEHIVGYAVLCFGFSLEFVGRDAFVDELYVREQDRGSGHGSKLITAILEICRAESIKALHLEADHFNGQAHEYYKRLGFRDHERHLMTKWL